MNKAKAYSAEVATKAGQQSAGWRRLTAAVLTLALACTGCARLGLSAGEVELLEAAKIDGASWWQIYRRVIVPISGPVFATAAILTVLPMWNQYLWPLMVVQSEEIRPVMVGLQYYFQLSIAWGEVMAFLSIITIPVLIIFLALQRTYIESIAESGIKG